MACGVSIIVKNERVLKVTAKQSRSLQKWLYLKTVLDRNMVTTVQATDRK